MLSTKADSINTLQEMQNEVLAQINNISENNTEDIAENKGANTENKEIPKETVKNEELIAKSDDVEKEKQQIIDNNQNAELKLKNKKENIIANITASQENLQNEIKNIENYSNNAVKIAMDKNKLSKIKEKKADSIYVKANRLKNKQIKLQEQTKANILKNESVQLKDEAVASYKLSERINDVAKTKRELDKELISEIEIINQTNDEGELKQKEDILRINSEQANKKFNITELAIKDDPKKVEDKEKEAKTYEVKAEKVEKDVRTLKVRVENIKKQVSAEKNSKKKTKLLKESENIEVEVNNKKMN